MTFPHDEQPDTQPDMSDVQAYDAYLDSLIAGYQPTSPDELSVDEIDFASQLVTMIHDTVPDASFASQLGAKLQDVAQQQTKMITPIVVNDQPSLFRYVRPLTTVAAVLILVVIVMLTVPPVRTLAQNIIDTLFFRAESDKQVLATPFERTIDPTPTFIVPTPEPPDLDEARRSVNFPINVPRWLPAGYQMVSAEGYDTYASIFYQHPDRFGIGLTIYPLPYVHRLEVGASAEVIDVQIGDTVGQYVPRGAWIAITETDGETLRYTGEIWDPTVNYQRLRWINDGLVYILATPLGAVSNLTMDDMVRIAESVP